MKHKLWLSNFANANREISSYFTSVYYNVSSKVTEIMSKKDEKLRTGDAMHKEAINLPSDMPTAKCYKWSKEIEPTQL